MDVEAKHIVGKGHSIEFDNSTWDKKQKSVRNRYTTAKGGFSPHSSSEMPITDVASMAIQTLNRDFLSLNDALAVLDAAVRSVRRKVT